MLSVIAVDDIGRCIYLLLFKLATSTRDRLSTCWRTSDSQSYDGGSFVFSFFFTCLEHYSVALGNEDHSENLVGIVESAA